MLGDGLVDLVESGAVTNARKPIDRGVSVTGLLIGTQRLFGFAHRNDALALRDGGYISDPAVLARLDRLVTINSALEVDLGGQVNAEQSGPSYLGGTGGQVDFVRAGPAPPAATPSSRCPPRPGAARSAGSRPGCPARSPRRGPRWT